MGVLRVVGALLTPVSSFFFRLLDRSLPKPKPICGWRLQWRVFRGSIKRGSRSGQLVSSADFDLGIRAGGMGWGEVGEVERRFTMLN